MLLAKHDCPRSWALGSPVQELCALNPRAWPGVRIPGSTGWSTFLQLGAPAGSTYIEYRLPLLVMGTVTIVTCVVCYTI